MVADWQMRIARDPAIKAGQPIIVNTRLTVSFILRLLGNGATVDEILVEYEQLTIEDIQACFLFAAQVLYIEV